MIRSHRQRHRRVLSLLTVCLPLAFAAGIAARRPPAIADSLPLGLGTSALPVHKIWERTDLFPKTALPVQLSREVQSARFSIRFVNSIALAAPDLLVYWLPGNNVGADTVPDDAVLLGTFSSPELRLPELAETQPGALLIYSLADDTVIEVSRPFAAVESPLPGSRPD